MDPNEKFGAAGFGSEDWIRSDTVIPYRINFENLGPGSRDANGNPYPTYATAPAQRVTVADQLASDLDWSTFRLTELGFGDTLVPVPADSTYVTKSVSLIYNGHAFSVDLEAGIDLATGHVYATFQSVDPLTSLPPDVLTGFLPPEDGTGRGMGHLSYTIRPKAGLPSGTEIRNVAQICFDWQEIIATNQVDPHDAAKGSDPTKEALNTIDAGPPTSQAFAPKTAGLTFDVTWQGSDDARGSGIASFDVYVADNGSPFILWQTATTQTSATFTGQVDHTYGFFSVATDNVGNREALPTAADAITTIRTQAPTTTVVTSDHDQGSIYGQAVTFTATVSAGTGAGTPTGSVQFAIDSTDFHSPVPLVNGAASITTSALAAGNHAVAALFTSDSEGFSPSSTDQALSQGVSPAPLTVTANNTTKLYWAPLPALTASYAGFVHGDTVASLTMLPTLATTAQAHSPVGDYEITVTGAIAADYAISYAAGTLTVTDSHWQNPVNPYDVTGEGDVTALDVLVIVDYINNDLRDASLPTASATPFPFYNVSGDDAITPLDVLMVVNCINAGLNTPKRAEGEGVAAGLPAVVENSSLVIPLSMKMSEGSIRRVWDEASFAPHELLGTEWDDILGDIAHEIAGRGADGRRSHG